MNLALITHLQKTIARTEQRLTELKDMLKAAEAIQANQQPAKTPLK